MTIFGETINIAVTNERFFRRLGYPADYEPSEYVEELMDSAKEWYKKNGNPWSGFYEVNVEIEIEKLYFSGVAIDSPKLLKRYKKHTVKKAVIIATTAGEQVDEKVRQLWAEDVTDEAFFLDAYSAAYAEAMIATGASIISKWAKKKGLNALSRFSPGYPGWQLEDQHQLMAVISRGNSDRIPIQVLESSLLTPKKSQFSVIGLYAGEEVREVEPACVRCSLLDCRCGGIFL